MDQITLTATAANWTEAAARQFAAVLSYVGVDSLRGQVESGAAQLFELYVDKSFDPCGWYVLRIDQSEEGPEGVVVAAVGHWAGVDITATMLPLVEKQFYGCVSVRVHTDRPGMVRKLLKQGYGQPEMIVRKKL